MKLSVNIITLNEESNIKRCLNSVRDFADEIVIVDTGSTDKTIEFAKKYTDKIYVKDFDNFASVRNYALEKSKGEWILSMDADEEITKSLADEIKLTIKNPKFDAYLIPRKNIIFGKEIKHSRWSPDKHIWLFKKSKAKFENNVHEEVAVNGSIGELKNAKIHHSHNSVHEFVSKFNNYSELESGKTSPNTLSFFIETAKSFVGRYLYKQGFRDGWRGFVLAYLRAIYKATIWVKKWEKSTQN